MTTTTGEQPASVTVVGLGLAARQRTASGLAGDAQQIDQGSYPADDAPVRTHLAAIIEPFRKSA